MTKEVIWTDRLMVPIAHFSHAARIDDVVHVGATAGTDAGRNLAGSTPGRVDVVAQTERMFENLETVLGLLGAGLEDVVRLKTYVSEPRDIPVYRSLYEKRFGNAGLCHAVVGSWGFPLPQAAIELDAVAVLGPEKKRLITKAPDARDGRFSSHGVRIGDTQHATALPFDPAGALPSDATLQSRQALDNLSAILTAAGLSSRQVVNLHVTLADPRDFPAFETAFRQTFAPPFPSATVVAAPLPEADMLIQIESVAVAGGGQAVASPEWPDMLAWASPAMLAGDTLYISGHLGLEPGTEVQTRAAWDGVRRLIAEAGFHPDSVLRTNNVLTDWRSYADFNAGYGVSFSDPYPPRATVLGQLLAPRAQVQVEAIAHRRGEQATIVQAAGFR